MRSLNFITKRFSTAKYTLEKDIPATVPKKFMNMYEAINSALDIALETDSTYLHYDLELKFLERM